MQVQKTVFISYRRTNVFTARAVYQYLTTHGYDAFLDFENIDAGSFEQVILNQIAARAHFIIVLTPSALERCSEPNDWLRREIEHAIDLKRNIVPLLFEGFDFGSMSQHLTGKLAVLSQYNGLRIPADYFDEAMNRLHSRFLNKPLEMILHPTPPADVPVVRHQQAAAAQEAPVTEKQLTAEEWLERGLSLDDNSDEELECYSEAIRLSPAYVDAYISRGAVHYEKGNLDAAIQDCNEALRLNPQNAYAYNNRGNVSTAQGDLDAAIQDYSDAIRLNPQYAIAYLNRGLAYDKLGDRDREIADYEAVIRIDPNHENAIKNLAIARRQRLEGR